MTRQVRFTHIALLFALYGALLYQTYRYQGDVIFYGEYIHWTGLQATHLLFVALAVTPLRRMFPQSNVVRWLAARRRVIGVAVFVYAAAHTIAYLIRQPGLQEVLVDGTTIGIMTGWLALLIFLPLAISSNDYSVRVLKGR